MPSALWALLVACRCAVSLAAYPITGSEQYSSPSNVHRSDELPHTGWTTARRNSLGEQDWPEEGHVFWRTIILRHLNLTCGDFRCRLPSRDMYQFGVYTGRSLRAIFKRLNEDGVDVHRFWGFDSFMGLPSESGGGEQTSRYNKLKEGAWSGGTFNAAEVLGTHSFRETTAKLEAYIGDSRVSGYADSTTSR